MVDSGEKTTRCAEACPTQALVFGDLDDPNSLVSLALKANAGKMEGLNPEFGTRPAVQYMSLPKPFITGEVLLADKPGECAKGARVTLQLKSGGKTLAAETDFLGDFEFKGLTKGAEYVLRAEYKGYAAKEITVKTDVSVNLGELVLAAK